MDWIDPMEEMPSESFLNPLCHLVLGDYANWNKPQLRKGLQHANCFRDDPFARTIISQRNRSTNGIDPPNCIQYHEEAAKSEPDL